jgi:HK97 family phage portal protein
MNLQERLKNAYKALRGAELKDSAETEVTTYGDGAEKLLEWLGIDSKNTKAINEVTYYTCLKLLAETIGKMPIKYYQRTKAGRIRAQPTAMTRLMSVRPNPYMTPTTMWTTTEMNCQHYGNGYIWIRRAFTPSTYGGEYKPLDMWPMQSNCVTVYMDDVGVFGDEGKLYYAYVDPKTGKSYMFPSEDVIHVRTWYSLDGITGQPVRKILKDTIEGMSAGQDVMNSQYKHGLSAAMAMQYLGDLSDGKRSQLAKKFADALSGPKNAGRVVPVPIGLTLTPLNISMADAQFAELRKASALQIAAAFGIKPNMINNYDKSSYASSEQQALDFLVNTELIRIKQYEEEIDAKTLEPWEAAGNYFYKFNEKVILRADAKTQMETLKDGVNNGIYKPNDARDYLDLPWDPAGDKLIVNGNYIPLEMVGQQYGISQEGGQNGTD